MMMTPRMILLGKELKIFYTNKVEDSETWFVVNNGTSPRKQVFVSSLAYAICSDKALENIKVTVGST